MIVNFQINGITVQANGDDDIMIRHGILDHLLDIQKIAASSTNNHCSDILKVKKTDIQDLDYDNDKNPEDAEENLFYGYEN